MNSSLKLNRTVTSVSQSADKDDTERRGRWLTFLIRIWEVTGSDLVPETGYTQ
jgi:hypothetical protein